MEVMRRNGFGFSPWADLLSLRRDMDTLFTAREAGESVVWAPPMNVREDAEHVVVELELPGVNPENVDVAVENGVLTISGEKRHERQDEQSNYHIVERRYGRFERSFTLARSIDAERVEANYADGILTITLPKREEAKPRRIRVSAGSASPGREVGSGQR